MYFGVLEPIWAKNYTPLTDEHVPIRVLSKTTDEKVNWPPILSIAANSRPRKRNKHINQTFDEYTRYKIITDHWLCAPDANLFNDKVIFVDDNGDITQPERDELVQKKKDGTPVWPLPDVRRFLDDNYGEDIIDFVDFVPHGSKRIYPIPSYYEFSIKFPHYNWYDPVKIPSYDNEKYYTVPKEYRKRVNVFAIAGGIQTWLWSYYEDPEETAPSYILNYKGEIVTIFWKSLIHYTETGEFKEVILSKPIRIGTRGVSIYAEPDKSASTALMTIAGGGAITGVNTWQIDYLKPEEFAKELGDVTIYNVNLEAKWVSSKIEGSPVNYIDIVLSADTVKNDSTGFYPRRILTKAPDRIHTEECAGKLAPMFHPQICNNYIYGGYYPISKQITNPEINIISDSYMIHANHHASWVYVIKNTYNNQLSIDIQGIIGGNVGTLEGGFMLPYSETDVEIIGGMDHNTGTWLPEKYRNPDITTHLPHINGKYLVPQPYSRIITDSNFTYNTNLLVRDCLYGTPIKIKSTLPFDLWVIPDSALAKSYSYPVPWTLIGYNKKKLYCSDIPNTSCYWKQTELDGRFLPYLFGGMSLMQEELEEYRTFIWCVDLNIPDESEMPHIEVTVLDWKVPHMYTSEDTSGVYVKDGTLYARSSTTEDIRL